MSLWLIQAQIPRFTVPMNVAPYSNKEFECSLAMVVPEQIDKALSHWLQRNHAWWGDDKWHVPKDDLRRIGLEMPDGTDPFTCFSWDRPSMKPRHYEDKLSDWDRKDFLDTLYARGIGDSRAQIEWLWTQFMNHALDWLINRDRDLDLGFCRIIATLYRANWRDRHLDHFLLPTQNLMDWNRDSQTCRRALEVEMLPAWFRASRMAEAFRLKLLGAQGYLESVFESMARGRDVMMRLYGSYLIQRGHPRAWVRQSPRPGVRRFNPNGRIAGSKPEGHPGRIGSGRRFTTIAESRKRRVGHPRSPLSGVPYLRTWYENLRATGRNAYQERRNGRAFRVLVLPAGEKPPEGDYVLVGGADKLPKGVAAGAERSGTQ